MALGKEFEVAALYGFDSQVVSVPLLDISVAWEILDKTTEEYNTKIVRASDGAEVKALFPTENLYKMLMDAGIPMVDAVNIDERDEKNYLVNLHHAELHATSADGAAAILAVKGIPAERSTLAKKFYALHEDNQHRFTPQEFQALKEFVTGQKAVPEEMSPEI